MPRAPLAWPPRPPFAQAPHRPLVALLALALAACAAPTPATGPRASGPKAKPSSTAQASPGGGLASEAPGLPLLRSPSPGTPASPGASPLLPVASADPLASSPLSAALNARLEDKLALVAKLGFQQNRSALISNHGGGLLSNHGGGLISNHGGGLLSNHGGGLISNNGGAYRLAQAPTPELQLKTSAQSGRPEGNEALLEQRLWVAGGGWTRFAIADVGERRLWLHPQGLWPHREVEEVALERFGNGDLKRQAYRETRLADDGSLRLLRREFQTMEPGTGKPLSYELEQSPLKVRFAELDFAQDAELYRLDRSSGTGAFRFRYPKTGVVEEGSLSEVALGPDGKLFIGLGDALSSYPGEATVKDAQGQVLYLKKRWLEAGVPHRSYDLGDGLVILLKRLSDTEGRGELRLNGTAIGQAALTIYGNGSHVFDLKVGDGPVKSIGYGDLSAPATPDLALARGPSWAVTKVLGEAQGDAQGPAEVARFRGLRGLVADPLVPKRWYAADHGNHRVVQIDEGASWTVTHLVGTGSPGDANGPIASATLRGPWGLAMGPDRCLYVAEADANRIRRIRLDATPPVVEAVAGGSPTGAWVDAAGPAARFKAPFALACIGQKLYVADWGNHRIRCVDLAEASFPVTTVAGSGEADTLDGPAATASLKGPVGLVATPEGKLVVATFNTLREVDLAQGQVRTLAGTAGQAPTLPGAFVDGPKAQAGLFPASALGAFGSEGWLVGAMDLRLVRPDGQVQTLAGQARFGGRDGPHDEALFNRIYGIAPAGGGRYLVSEGKDGEESSSAFNSRLRLLTPP